MYKLTKRVLAEQYLFLSVATALFFTLWFVLLRSQPASREASGVLVWWTALCSVTLFNICGWRISASSLTRHKDAVDPADYRFQRWQLILSAVYVLGCGFRSIFPRADVQRIGLVDSWLSSVMVGRTVATIAELCFMAQWALFLNRIARDAGFRPGVVISHLILPLIFIAEICSWLAVLTTSYLGNAIEETIWAISVTLLIVSVLGLWPRSSRATRAILLPLLVLGVAYVVFMCTVDIPMYATRWMADEANGREYLTLSQGIQDVWSRWIVTHDWEAWRTEIPWMSLYFSVAVWSSIALIHAPRFHPEPCPQRVKG